MWIPTTTTEEKEAAGKARSADAKSQPVPHSDDLSAPFRVIEPRKIPQTRRMIATETFWSGPDYVKLGQAYDVDDAVVKRVPQYFRPAIEPDAA